MSQPDWYMQLITNGQFRLYGNHLWDDNEFGGPHSIPSPTSLTLKADLKTIQCSFYRDWEYFDLKTTSFHIVGMKYCGISVAHF